MSPRATERPRSISYEPTPMERRALESIAAGATRCVDIARMIGVSRARANELARALWRKGLVRREPIRPRGHYGRYVVSDSPDSPSPNKCSG